MPGTRHTSRSSGNRPGFAYSWWKREVASIGGGAARVSQPTSEGMVAAQEKEQRHCPRHGAERERPPPALLHAGDQKHRRGPGRGEIERWHQLRGGGRQERPVEAEQLDQGGGHDQVEDIVERRRKSLAEERGRDDLDC